MKKTLTMLLTGLLSAVSIPAFATADDDIFYISETLLDAGNAVTLGLSPAPGTETFTVFSPSDGTDHFSNGIVLAHFKDALYCMWQSSRTDEDAADTWVAYARSTDDGLTWTEPMVLCPTIDNGYVSSGGWLVTADRLVAYINTWPSGLSPKGGYTQFMTSADGLTWTDPQPVTMSDGTTLNGIFEQDPHVLPSGRILNAAHFQPGLKLQPIYTDDASGTTGWQRAQFAYQSNGDQSRELEPSFYQKADGTLVMVCRDQKNSMHKLASVSTDQGLSWSASRQTNFPDSRAKQSAGNLPDGTAFQVNNPIGQTKPRTPLVVALSADGTLFDRAFLLRSANDLPAQRYSGKSKTLGFSYPKSMVHNGFLYVAYSTNKEDVEYTRIPLSSLTTGIHYVEADASGDGQATQEAIYATDGTRRSHLVPGLNLVRMRSAQGKTFVKKVFVEK